MGRQGIYLLSPWCHSLLPRRTKITSIHTAVIGVLGTYAIVNVWNTSGWVMGLVTVAYVLGTSSLSSLMTSGFEWRNGY